MDLVFAIAGDLGLDAFAVTQRQIKRPLFTLLDVVEAALPAALDAGQPQALGAHVAGDAHPAVAILAHLALDPAAGLDRSGGQTCEVVADRHA